MGILRADRIAGLGGANAIKGSVFFDGASTLTVQDSDDFHYDTGDFTIEGWIFATGRDNQMMLLGQWDGAGSVAGSLAWAVQLTNNTNGFLRFLTSSTGTNVVLNQNGTSGTVFDNQWHHFAVTRNGNDYKLFTDGVVVGSVTDSNAITNSPFPLTIGGSNRRYVNNTDSSQTFTGFLSNIRIIKGEALYTAAFTPPTSELTVTPNTVFLGCQSSNILREETGKILSIDKSSTKSGSPTDSGPIPSKFTPNSPVGFSTTTDVGSQYGSTFDGFGNFATSTYMVPPGGNTRERGRGRGVHMLGYHGSPSAGDGKRIDYITIQSQGNSIRFGDMTVNRYTLGAGANSTRALFTGGYITGNSPDTDVNNIEFITIASEGNAIDFGDRTQVGRLPACASNDTRCVMASAKTGAGNQDTIDFVQFATTGNATGFGDLSSARASMNMSCNSTTRGIFSGGYQPSPVTANINTIEFIQFATTGNGTNFGDLSSAAANSSGGTASSSTRGLIGLGFVSPARVNTIDFITMASEGDALDFGDLTLVRQAYGSLSNSTRGVFLGGNDPYTNTIDFVTIATTGNASPFGELNVAQSGLGAAGSDSHGGLS